MFVQQVVSYLDAWKKLTQDHSAELNDILEAASNYYSGKVVLDRKVSGFSSSRADWDKAFIDLGWSSKEERFFSPSGKRVRIGPLGPVKNGVSVQLNIGSPSWFHNWLFSRGALAVRYGMVRIPVMIAPVRSFDKSLDSHRSMLGYNSFEFIKDQLETLAPLSSKFPFLIIGISDQQQLLPPEVFELSSDPNVVTERIVIDRCIEFPHEYHQAGLGILNYFGTFLRENYPDKEAKVRIEQVGLTVRMTVETTDGNVETVEKALRDYELIVSGHAKPEAITTNEKAILEIRNELRIAKVRIEAQQDIIGLQSRQIEKFMEVIAQSLQASQTRPIAIQVSPTFNNSNTVTMNPDVSETLKGIYELLESIPVSEEAYMVLNDLSGSLEAIETESDSDKLKGSAGITKLGRFLRKLSDGNESLNTAISNVEKGQQIVGDIAKNYNKLASFCGLPTIPFL